ncbi:MAG: hypothetical protein JWO72_2238 [Caulobacteraceae bacterium]|jgi:hypothetical protein|nr:hypothetical protein [Caulobacteraceae bacterium]
MTRLRICLGVLLAAGAAVAAHAQASYPGDRALVLAQAKAKAASFPCEAQLKAGGKAPACERYHAAVLQAMALENRRFDWCNARATDEHSTLRVPDSCLGKGGGDMRLDAVESLERRTSPQTWRRFDQAMTRLPGGH